MILTGKQQVDKMRSEGISDTDIISNLISLYDNSLDLLQQLMSQQISDVLKNITVNGK